MATTDILFKEKLHFHDKKTTGKRILWISLSAAASILLLLGLFTIFRNNRSEKQLAENIMPVKNTVPPSEALNIKKTESETSTLPIIPKNEIHAYKKSTSPASAAGQSTKPLPISEIAANKKTEVNSIVEEEVNQKENFTATAGQPVAMADTSSLSNAALAMKSVAYNASEEPSSNRTKTASATAFGARRSAKYKKDDLALANDEALDKKEASTEQDQIFVKVEEPATFQGADINKFREYVVSQFKYPDGADIFGKVTVQFVVDTKGKVTDIKILQGLVPDVDNEIIQILKNSPLWTPGKQAGKTVKQQFVMPINISIH
jgi:TonB family protein